MTKPTSLHLAANPGDPDPLALDRGEAMHGAPDLTAPDRPAASEADPGHRNTGVVVGRDALGNVFVTGDGNSVEVKLTVVVADTRLRATEASASALDNPYRGLDAFRETDSAVFFGRDDLVRQLWRRFHALQRDPAPRLLPILGASGSGKSSLVRAGLLPELVRQPMEGMRSPRVLVLRPGAKPLQRLADVLARIAPVPEDGHAATSVQTASPGAVDILYRAAEAAGEIEPRVVVFVDQLEELFTECTSEPDRGAFLATLAHAAAQPDGVVTVVFAMRNDFTGSLRAHEAFATAVRGQSFRVSQMSKPQLVAAIERPADDLGHPWPTGLVENLVLQCDGRAGALPLLQFALKRLWSEHVAGRLARSWSSTLIEDFVVNAADDLVDRSGPAEDHAARKRILRRAFLAMVQLGEGTADTRRVARLSEIVARGETGEQVRTVLAPFVAPEARLVTASEVDGEPTYELAHEALIGSWDQLRAWLGHVPNQAEAAAIRGELRLRRRLRYAAAGWRGDRDALMRPPELERIKTLRQHDPEELSTLEHAFIDASIDAWEAHDRWRRRARALGIGAAVVFVVVVSILGLVAWRSAQMAKERLAASDLEQGRALLLDGHPMRALPYLLAARTEGIEHSPVLQMLFARAAGALPLTVLEHRDRVTTAAFSPDGARVVTASYDGTARVWDARTGQPVSGLLEHRDRVTTAAFSPDGAHVVTASWDHTARVWDARTGQPLFDPLEHRDRITAVAFSPDGTSVVTAGRDNTARVWDAHTGKPIFDPLDHRARVTAVAFSPDGTSVVTASWDHAARVWDAHTGKPVFAPLEHRATVTAVAFSPDGTSIVTTSTDGTARVWDARTGKPVFAPLEHRATVTAAAFSPDGARVVTASTDGTARVWNARTGNPVSDPLEHRDSVMAAMFSPDGACVVTASADGTARVWDTRTSQPISDPLEHRDSVTAAMFSLDGACVVTASADGTARAWDARTGKPVSDPLEHRAMVTAAAFSPDGARVVTASYDGTARVWDARTGQPISDPLEHRDSVTATMFSLDGACVITASADGTARVWDVRTGKPVSDPLEHRTWVTAAAFSPDGARVVTASTDGTALVWDARTGKPVSDPLEHRDRVTVAAFSPDGARVVTASTDRTARIWDARTGKPLSDPLEHRDRVTAAAFSPDSARVVTASADGIARIWDARTGKLVLDSLKHRAWVTAAAFSPDGTRVVTASYNTARIWDARTGKAVSDPLEHRDTVTATAFSPDGARVITASDDGTARVWDARTGKPVSDPLEHRDRVTVAAFSPDGARVVTAGWDRTACVWDARTGKPVSDPLKHRDTITAAAFSPDGARVITASYDHTARVWVLPMDLGSLEDWNRRARCGPFALDSGVLVQNHAPCP